MAASLRGLTARAVARGPGARPSGPEKSGAPAILAHARTLAFLAMRVRLGAWAWMFAYAL